METPEEEEEQQSNSKQTQVSDLVKKLNNLKLNNQEEEDQQSNSKRTQLSDLVKKLNNLKLNNDEEQEQQQLTNQSTISFFSEIPEDIISQILSNLPVKTLLQFRSVSKPWLSLISNPSFNKLHFSQATSGRRTHLLISAHDTFTRKRYLLSAARDGGPVTLIEKPYARTINNKETTEIEHLNGLVLFNSGNGFFEHNFAYIVNPGTRKMFKLDGPGSEPEYLSYGKGHICYFFGFDELRHEHKVLTVRMFDIVSLKPFKPNRIEIMIFNLSSLSWRKIDVDLPCEIIREWNIGTKHSVCVNSVIHLILQNRNEILVFDLRTEKFSIVNLPFDALRYAIHNSYCKKGLNTIISDQPFLMKINGFLGVLCPIPAVGFDMGLMDIWTLKDYENRSWVRRNICFSRSWFLLDGPFPLNSSIKSEYVYKSATGMVDVLMYDVESKSIKSVNFTLGYQFLRYARFDHVRSYTESILPLPSN